MRLFLLFGFNFQFKLPKMITMLWSLFATLKACLIS